jgi:hypothetical protein
VVCFGTHRSGTPRLWCKVCRKRFTPVPKARRVTPAPQARMTGLRHERLSQRAVARALQVSRDTVRRTPPKRPPPSGCVSTSSRRCKATRWRSTRWWCAPSGSPSCGRRGRCWPASRVIAAGSVGARWGAVCRLPPVASCSPPMRTRGMPPSADSGRIVPAPRAAGAPAWPRGCTTRGGTAWPAWCGEPCARALRWIRCDVYGWSLISLIVSAAALNRYAGIRSQRNEVQYPGLLAQTVFPEYCR